MDHDCNKEDVIDRNIKDIGSIFEMMEKIKNRLPNWATLVISLLTLSVGSLATLWIGAMVKMKGN